MWSDARWRDVEPRIIVIRNGVDAPPPTADQKVPPTETHRGNHALSELLAPLATLWNTRTAHADLSRGELEKQPILAATQDPHQSGAVNGNKPMAQNRWAIIPTHEFDLTNSKTVVPLGWVLSETAIGEMHAQIATPPGTASARSAVLESLTLERKAGAPGK